MCARLLAITFDLLAAAFITGTGHALAFLNGKRDFGLRWAAIGGRVVGGESIDKPMGILVVERVPEVKFWGLVQVGRVFGDEGG